MLYKGRVLLYKIQGRGWVIFNIKPSGQFQVCYSNMICVVYQDDENKKNSNIFSYTGDIFRLWYCYNIFYDIKWILNVIHWGQIKYFLKLFYNSSLVKFLLNNMTFCI